MHIRSPSWLRRPVRRIFSTFVHGCDPAATCSVLWLLSSHTRLHLERIRYCCWSRMILRRWMLGPGYFSRWSVLAAACCVNLFTLYRCVCEHVLFHFLVAHLVDTRDAHRFWLHCVVAAVVMAPYVSHRRGTLLRESVHANGSADLGSKECNSITMDTISLFFRMFGVKETGWQWRLGGDNFPPTTPNTQLFVVPRRLQLLLCTPVVAKSARYVMLSWEQRPPYAQLCPCVCVAWKWHPSSGSTTAMHMACLATHSRTPWGSLRVRWTSSLALERRGSGARFSLVRKGTHYGRRYTAVREIFTHACCVRLPVAFSCQLTQIPPQLSEDARVSARKPTHC